jgi:hypothetical protein
MSAPTEPESRLCQCAIGRGDDAVQPHEQPSPPAHPSRPTQGTG